MLVWIDSSRYPFSTYLLVTLLHYYQRHRRMTAPSFANPMEMWDKEEQKKEEVIAYLSIACRLWGKFKSKDLWLCGFYLCFFLQLTYVTVDVSNAPTTESKKPKKAQTVEYTGVHPGGHKVYLQGTHTYILIAGIIHAVKGNCFC